MKGLGDQENYRRVKSAVDKGAVVSESKRRTEPTAEELQDPYLLRCKRTNDAFQANKGMKPRNWKLLHRRDEAFSDAEEAGRSLRAIARVTGISHTGVRAIINSWRYDGEDGEW